jgi:hypothetical protein
MSSIQDSSHRLANAAQLQVDLSPPPVLDTLTIGAGRVTVVREDLLPGGTKQRALLPYLSDALAGGCRSFVYASPPPGYAQVALAYVAQRLGVGCTVFGELTGAGSLHEYSRLARSYGATVHPAPSLAAAEADAAAHAATVPDCCRLPLGFGDACFMAHYRAALTRAWTRIVEELGHLPRRVWLPVGSATLATVFRQVVPAETTLLCVNVRVLARDDARLRRLAQLPGVVLRHAPELFHEPCATPVPIPSNEHYDAKLWRLVRDQGSDRDLWWNVAR